MATDPLLTVAEELYGLDPADFTGTRNEWAKQTKADGSPELAKQIAQLRRPSVPAWVVNMLMRRQGEQMTQVLELGASLRQAQADLDGDALRELARQRRQLTAAVTQQGRALAGELGHRLTEAVAEQVQGTLHAAMVDEQAAAAVRSGLLVAALSATGVGPADVVDAVAVPAAIGLTARPRTAAAGAEPRNLPRRPDLTVVPDEPAAGHDDGPGRSDRSGRSGQEPRDEAQARAAATARAQAEAREAAEAQAREEAEARRRAADRAVQDAEEAVDEALERVRKAKRRLDKAQARTLQAADELDQVRRRVAELEHQLEGLDVEVSTAEDKLQRAEGRHADAVEVLGEARAVLDDLE